MAGRGTVEIVTELSVGQAKALFRSTVEGAARRVELGAVEPGGPFDDEVDFAGYASVKTLTGGWIVQIYVVDEGARRRIQLVPVGSSMLGRAVGGLRNTVSRAAGQEKVELLLDAFRAADPTLAVKAA